jgi:hypothetical protein
MNIIAKSMGIRRPYTLRIVVASSNAVMLSPVAATGESVAAFYRMCAWYSG